MTLDHQLLWETARVGGFVAYLLATVSVGLGIVLSLKLRSSAWPRFITDGLHRHVTLVSLVFIALHTVTVWLDPFTAFNLGEVFVPFTTHYRPLWIGLGIVASYLLLAVWASERVRSRIGYAWWRRFHYLSFAVFVLGALHGIGAGSDTATGWGFAIYLVSVAAIAGLLVWRLAVARVTVLRGPAVAIVALSTSALLLWTVVAPMQPGWNQIANNGNGSGESASYAATVAIAKAPDRLTLPFTDTFTASLADDERLSGTLTGPHVGRFSLGLESGALEVRFDSTSCRGAITQADDRRLGGECTTPGGQRLAVELDVERAVRGTFSGALIVSG